MLQAVENSGQAELSESWQENIWQWAVRLKKNMSYHICFVGSLEVLGFRTISVLETVFFACWFDLWWRFFIGFNCSGLFLHFMCYWTFTGKYFTALARNIFIWSTHSQFVFANIVSLLVFNSTFFHMYFIFPFIILSCMLLFLLACRIKPTSILKGSHGKRVSLPPLGKVTQGEGQPQTHSDGKVVTLIWAENPVVNLSLINTQTFVSRIQ